MAKPAHTRVTFSGVVGSVSAPIERWSFNINFPADALPSDGTDTVADAVASSLAADYASTLKVGMPDDVVLTEVRAAHVLADGHVATRADGSYVQGVWTGSHVGWGAKQAVPLQTALCISLVTGRPGPTGKGRYFSPWPDIPIDSTTQLVNETAINDKANQHAAFLNALATTMTFAPQVVSSKGYMTEVIGVRVGRAPDTMRSRREDVPEGYKSAFLA
jgi:hypothetical protein